MSRAATAETLPDGLRRGGGVAAGDTLIVHASFKALGPVEGGPAAVVAALRAAIGDVGTLVMPTFSDPQPDGRFDVRSTPSRVGAITECFRTAPGVLRSEHPTHAVAAAGPRAAALLAGHRDKPGLGVDTPLHRAADAGARVLMLGCAVTTCSVIHVAESICRVPYLGRAWYPGYDRTLTVVDAAGAEHVVPPRDPPGDSSQFGKVQEVMERRGQLQRFALAQAEVLSFRAGDALAAGVDLLRADPLALLCRSPRCEYCVMARRAVATPRVHVDVSGWAPPAPARRPASADA